METDRAVGAVDDLRRLLEVLRAEDDDAARTGRSPGLAQLGELVDGLPPRRAAVRLHGRGGCPPALPTAVDVTGLPAACRRR